MALPSLILPPRLPFPPLYIDDSHSRHYIHTPCAILCRDKQQVALRMTYAKRRPLSLRAAPLHLPPPGTFPPLCPRRALAFLRAGPHGSGGRPNDLQTASLAGFAPASSHYKTPGRYLAATACVPARLIGSPPPTRYRLSTPPPLLNPRPPQTNRPV